VPPSLRGALAPKQSRLFPQRRSGLLPPSLLELRRTSRFARNDDVETVSRAHHHRSPSKQPGMHRSSRGAWRPGCAIGMPLENARAQGRPGADWHLRPPCNKKHGVGTTGSAGTTRPSLRDGLHAYRQSPWCAGLVGHLRARRSLVAFATTRAARCAGNTSIGVSGPCHFTSVPTALVKRLRSRPPQPTPRIVTTRTPLAGGGLS
jgi:hypothetical protein